MLEMVEGYRLSPQQRRFWAREPESPAGVACCMIGITGAIDPPRLREAGSRLVAHHEILRTHFRRSPGIKLPIQIVGELAEISWRELDLRSSDPAERERELVALQAAESAVPFDLERGALLRAVLVRLSDESSRLLLLVPAVAVDALSLRNLFEDLVRSYGGVDLDEEPVQHLQFSEWHHEFLESEEAEAGRSFWSQRRFQEVGKLPLERDGAVETKRATSRHLLKLPSAAAGQIAALASRYEASGTSLLLAGWHALLARLTGSGEVGTAFLRPARKYRELDEAVGPLAIAVPVVSQLRGDLPFLRLWKRLDEEIAEAVRWQESYAPESDAPGPTIGFELVETPGPRQAGGARFTLLDFDSPAEPFLLKLSCRLGESALEVALSYAPESFPGELVEFLGERFQALLESALEAPERSVDALEILGPRERRLLVQELNDTRTELPPITVDRMLTEALGRRPEVDAVIAGEVRLSHGRLLARANQIARHLRDLGVGPDDLVAVCLPRSPELIVAIVGVLQAGGAFLPLDPGYPRQRLDFMLADSRARLLVTTESLLDRFPEPGRPVLCLDRDAAVVAALPEDDPGGLAEPDSLAYVIYTSGSTGRPKGTMIPHRGLANYLRWAVSFYRAGEGTGAPLHSPIGFDLTITSLFAPLLSGTTVHVVPEGDGVEGLAKNLREQGGYSFAKLTPAHLEILCEMLPAPEARGRAGALVIGGEALRYGTLRFWREHAPETRLINEYGPTETVVGCAVHEVASGEPATGAVPIGRPIANMALYLLDDRLLTVPLGGVGEIFIGGEGVARGYLGRPDLSAERFVPDPFGPAGARLYRTGDLARLLLPGYFEFLGRADGQVKVRGFRIELGEIERALADHPGVREAAVVAKDDPSGSRLVAFFVGDAERKPTTGELRSFLQGALPEPMLPAAFVPLPSLPLTPNGKVDRAALREMEEEPAASLSGRAPRTQTESLVADLWAQLLRRDQVSLGDNFFDLGGHSLFAMQLIARIRNVFDVELSINDFLEEPTLAGLARRVEDALRRSPGAPLPPLEPVDRSRDLPPSFAQERLWLLDQLQPGTIAYNVPAAFAFTGLLNAQALEQAWNEIVRRHEVLRTHFERREGGPVQVIERFASRALPLIDLRGLPEERGAEESVRLAAVWARRLFDLSRGPLARAALVRLGSEEHRLFLTLHHIVCDAWSMEVLIAEWAALYTAFCQGAGSPLPELPVQYADFAQWQRSWLRGEVLEQQLAVWLDRLQGAPPVLDLPTPRPRPAVQTFRGAKRSRSLAPPLVARLQALARGERVTPFMLLLSGFEALLYRYAGQEEFLVGSPIAGRNHLKLEGLIGFFINTLVFRADLSGSPELRTLLGRVRRDALHAFASPDLPFEKLLEELPQERDRSRPPLFQVVFSMQSPPALPDFLLAASSEARGLTMRSLASGTGTSKVDLNLEMTGGETGLSATLEYNTDLFDEPSAGRLLDHFEALLESAAEALETPVSELSLLRGSERQQILSEWSLGASEPVAVSTLHRLFELHAAKASERRAVVFGSESLTYGDLNRRANRLARYLGTLGVGPEVLVGVCMERSVEMVVALLAIWKAGAAYVPLDPSYPMERLAFIFDDTRLSVLVTHERATGNLPVRWAFLVDVDAIEETLSELDDRDLDLEIQPESLAYAIYTSGSTGQPKGVLVPHAGLANLALAQSRAFGVGPESRVLQFASLSFDASASELGMAFAPGATLILADRESLMPGPDLLELFARQAVTHVTLPPSALAVLPASEAVPGTLIVAGEACPPELVARWAPGRRFFNAYGPTECTVCATLTEVEADGGRPPIGRPLANTRVYLLDPWLAPVPAGLPGEICVGGIGVARGYLDRPGISAERFVPDPFGGTPGARLYRTGDLARFLPDGRLEFLGRRDDQVKIRGFRIEPGEVEAALAGHRAVEQCAVVAREEGTGQLRLVAYFVSLQEPAPTPDELREFLQESLPAHFVPALFVAVPSMPLLPNGKVDRRQLPGPDRLDLPGRKALAAPRTDVEELLAGIWSEVLGSRRCGIHESFFDLGGSSLSATQVLSRVRDVFGVDVSLGRLFASPTLSGLAGEIEEALRGTAAAAPPIRPATEEGDAPLSYSQELMWRTEQKPGGSRVNGVPAALRLTGELDRAALEASLREIFRRQEALRTTFPVVDGTPVQRIGPVPMTVLPFLDLTDLPAGEGEAAFGRLAREEIRRPFDLERGPVLRPLLVRLGEQDHVLLLTSHHIAVDQWSAGVFARELAVLYEAVRSGAPSPLPELAIQYTDFSRWQRSWLSGEVLAGELGYWRDRLAGAAPVELPGRARLSGDSGSETESVLVAPPLAEELEALGRRQGATLSMILLAALNVVVSELTLEKDLLVAAPIANRNRSEIEPLIGFFANTLVLRTDLSGDPTWTGLLASVRETALGAFLHQDLPIEVLAEALEGSGLTQDDLFRIGFNMQNAPIPPLELSGLRVEPVPVQGPEMRSDLLLAVTQSSEGLLCRFQYRRGLFTGEAARELARRFHQMLAELVKDPDRRLSGLAPKRDVVST